MGERGQGDAGERPVRELTVAAVREPPGADFVEVAFLESARFYRLPRQNPEFAEALASLRAAQAAGRRLRVAFTTPHGDTIAAVAEEDKEEETSGAQK
jgi:hypothetical protein